ncbi:MAG: DUF4071 domain-containing protein [Armatimonadetes bacterium]|nr:DUF4071 domain-containing protein [Armatimonadota bacterium]
MNRSIQFHPTARTHLTPSRRAAGGDSSSNGLEPRESFVRSSVNSAAPAPPQAAPPTSPPPTSFTIVGPDGKPIPVTLGPNGQLQITDVNALSSMVEAARQSHIADPGFVNPLQNIPPREMGPLGDFLQIPAERARETLAERQPAIHEWSVHHKHYTSELKSMLTDASGKAREIPLEALRAFEERWTEENPSAAALEIVRKYQPVPAGSPPGTLPPALPQLKSEDAQLYPDEVTMLVEAFKDRGSFEDVARFYEKMRSRNPNLACYEVPREYYIVSLNKLKKIKESIRESEAFINERVEAIHHGPMGFIEASRRNVYRSLGINGEILGGMGKAYKVIYQEAEKQIDNRVAQADFTKLFEQLSGTRASAWKNFGEKADEKTRARFLERFETLRGREESLKNSLEMLEFVEQATGAKLPENELSRLRKSEDPVKTVEELTGKKLGEWNLHGEELQKIASAAVNKLAGKIVRGKTEREELLKLGRELTGHPLSGPVTAATFNAKVDEMLTQVTEKGTLDTDMAAFVEKNAGMSIGRNLLKASRKALEVSRNYYLAGFGVDFEYYPGINVIYNDLALGNHRTAELMAPLVQYAVMREGGATSTDYWNLATQAELATIADQPETVHQLLPRLFASAKAGWELGSTADNLEWLGELRREDGRDSSLVDFVAARFRERMAIGFPPREGFDPKAFAARCQEELAGLRQVQPRAEVLTPDEQQRKEITDKIFARGKHFQDVFNSKFIGGSWKFVSRGGVADRPINRQTVRALREVNRHLGLGDLTTPDQFPVFRSRAHRYIDTKFYLVDKTTGERPMEDLESQIHKKRDTFTQARHDVCDSRTSGTAQTNLAVEIMLGQSDCRDTDATYQGMFDVWKRDCQTRHLQGCLDAILDGHAETLKREFAKATEWDRLQVVSLDLGFFSPTQLKTDENGNPIKYAIKKDAKGRPIRTQDGDILRDARGNPLAQEDHSMPFLVRMDEKRRILPDGLTAVDPFYQHFYPLANRSVDPTGILNDERGFYLGKMGVQASDGKAIDFWGKPTKYSGAAPQKISGECGQVTFGGHEVAMNDLEPLLSDDNRLAHLVDAMTRMVTGTTKERVLNAVLSRILDEAASDTHTLWKRAKDRDLIDPESPFLGYGPERVVVGPEIWGKSPEGIRRWLAEQAPGAEIPDYKLEAIQKAPEGAVVFDPHFKTYAELLDSDSAVRWTGEAAIAPLALSLYLQDLRYSEDVRYVLDNMLSGQDERGMKELEKLHRVAYVAAQMVQGERQYDNAVDVMRENGETQKLVARPDFLSWHTIHQNDPELAELDAYTLKPAAEWLLQHLETVGSQTGTAVLEKVMGDLIEASAADAHNVGWKTGKDRALADASNPFLGYAPKRQRISSKTSQVADMSREQIAAFYGLPADQVSEQKAETIRQATRKAVADGVQAGADVTHHLYKEYTGMLKDQPDGGTRLAGANAVPLMTLALYLSDFRGQETETVDGLRKVLAGLLSATDRKGLEDVTILNHVAFQAAQLPYGERSTEVEVPQRVKSGAQKMLKGRSDINTFSAIGEGSRSDNAEHISAGLRWMTRDLDSLVQSQA